MNWRDKQRYRAAEPAGESGIPDRCCFVCRFAADGYSACGRKDNQTDGGKSWIHPGRVCDAFERAAQ